MGGIQVRVLFCSGLAAAAGAVAFVAELDFAYGGCADGEVECLQAGVVAARVVGGVDGGVAEAIVQGDGLSLGFAPCEGGLEGGDLKSAAPLDGGAVFRGVADGAEDCARRA